MRVQARAHVHACTIHSWDLNQTVGAYDMCLLTIRDRSPLAPVPFFIARDAMARTASDENSKVTCQHRGKWLHCDNTVCVRAHMCDSACAGGRV